MPYTILRSVPSLCNPRLHTFHVKTYDSFEGISECPRPAEHQDFEEHAIVMLSRLLKICPELREFSLGVIPSSVPIVKSVVDACCNFRRLTSFCCGEMTLPLTFKAITHLALLPDLQVLMFASDRSFWTFDDFWLLDHKPKDKIFPSLRNLGMISSTIDVPLKLLPYVSSRHLEQITIKIDGGVPRKRVKPLFGAIADLKGRRAIEHIHIVMDVLPTNKNSAVTTDGDACPEPISETTLGPLLGLSKLSRLILDILCPWSINDDLLHRMSLVWPNLTVLELGIERPWPLHKRVQEPGVTLVGLIVLSHLCEHLHTLGLELTPNVAEVNHSQGTFPSVFVRLAPLENLCVGLSRIEADEEMAVAGILSNAFPTLKQIDSYWATLKEEDENRELEKWREAQGSQEESVEAGTAFEPDEALVARWAEYEAMSVKWHEVERTIPELFLVRTQERRWNSEHRVYEKAARQVLRDLDVNDEDKMRELVCKYFHEDGWTSYKLRIAFAMQAAVGLESDHETEPT